MKIFSPLSRVLGRTNFHCEGERDSLKAEVERLRARTKIAEDGYESCQTAFYELADQRDTLRAALEDMIALTNRLSLHSNDLEFVRRARAALSPAAGGEKEA